MSNMSDKAKPAALFDGAILRPAALDAFAKLSPLKMWRNPVMFATELVALYVTILFVRDLAGGGGEGAFAGQIALWLWATVWFAAFAEAVAEGRGKAQAASLRRARSELTARRIIGGKLQGPVAASDLKIDETVEVVAGELIPAMARSLKASPRWTKAPSRAKARL
jgi:K+-transporting ATPase ATPase B chain